MDSQTNTSNSAHNHPTLSQIEQDALTKAKRRPKAAPAMAPGAVATTDDSEAAPDTHKREAASSALASIGQDVLAKGGTWTSSDAGNTHSTKLNEPMVVTKDSNHLESRDSYINRLNEKINMQEEATAKKDPEKPSFDRSSTTSSGTGAIAVAGIGYDETASEKFTTAGKDAKPSAGSDKTMQSKIAGKHAKLSADSDKSVQSKIDEIDRGLAVAMLVEEGSYDGEKDNIHFPSATAYDPDSKPSFHKNRRFRLYGILGLLLLVGIAVAIAVGVTSKSEASEIVNTFSPTVAPTSIAPVLPDDQQIVDRMVQLVGPSANNSSNPSSPSYLAREWILKEDAMNLTYASPTLDQRYLLSVFYFATNFPGRVSPLGCTKPNATEEDSCVFKTRNLQKPVTVPKLVTRLSYNSTRWLTNTSECDWAGLECNDDGNLAAILLREFLKLRCARVLWTYCASTGGTISSIMCISLVCVCSPFSALFLAAFQDINANIPSELGKLSHLNRLSLIKNGLSGTIPSELGQLNDLLDFELLYNRVLTGTIPEAIWEMSNLQILNLLDAGPLEGTIPSLIGNMKALKGLFLSCFNADVAVMSGTIPSEFALMSDLSE